MSGTIASSGAPRGALKRIRPLAAACAAAAALLLAAWAAPAWAAEAHPVQSAVEAGASGARIVNAVGLEGAGETVYVTVRRGGAEVARLVPHEIGSEGSGGGFADVFAIEAVDQSELEASLAAGLSVVVYADKAGKTALYEGAVWPVWADLPGAGRKLIGTHTGAGGFSAPASLAEGGRAYRLAGAAEQSGNKALEFAYEPYEPAKSADGSIRYVDVATGEALSEYTPIPGLEAGAGPREVEVPRIVESDGKVYRTMPASRTVAASNPGALSFTVPAAALSSAAASAAGHYMAVIEFADAETGEAVASDAVWVRGEVAYTTPDTIYRAAGASSAAEEYNRADGEPAVLSFSAARDGVTTGSRTVRVLYDRADPGSGSPATFALIDGSRRVGDAARTIGSAEGEYPPSAWTAADGSEYELVGEPADYGPLASGAADAYYLPKGYSGTPAAYTVKVSYVDYATRSAIDSEEFESSPDNLADVTFEPPAQFESSGSTWIRLDGQESISHSYWSGITEYTVYYRDRSVPPASAPTVTQVRVVYRDAGTTTTTNANANANAAATTNANANANAGTANANANAPADERLDSGQSYDVAQGGGAPAQATGRDGRDAVQQRIDEDANPLAGGTSGSSAPAAPADQAASGEQGLPAPAIAGIVAGIVALVAVVAAVALRRRRNG